MMPVIYTPTEGDAIQKFSELFRRPAGCFLNINDIKRVHDDLKQWGNPEDIDYVVVSGILTPTQLYFFLTSDRRGGNSRNWRSV